VLRTIIMGSIIIASKFEEFTKLVIMLQPKIQDDVYSENYMIKYLDDLNQWVPHLTLTESLIMVSVLKDLEVAWQIAYFCRFNQISKVA
jgi:hypothetical protein